MGDTENLAIAIIIVLAIYMFIRCNCVKIYRFSRPGCGFCVSTQDEWNKFSFDMLFKMVRPINVNLDSPGSGSLAREYKVIGVPTIIKVNPDGTPYLYSGDRSAEDLSKWVVL